MFTFAYRVFGLVGLMSVFASLMWGFRHDPSASVQNYYFNFGIYFAYMALHLIATRAWFKKAIYGKEEGSPGERRMYIYYTVLGWGAILYFHKPLPGLEYALPGVVGFIGMCLALIGLFFFIEGKTIGMMDGFLGVPGADFSHSHTNETPLLTEGSYGRVRHPMYSGAMLTGTGALLMHPNMAQVFWTAIIGMTFVMFIPIEEKQLIHHRGDEYKEYQTKVRWRLIPGIW